MKIEIPKSSCEHLKDISYYNNNYYRLPVSIGGYNILFECYDGADEFCGNSIGSLVDEKFVPVIYLHQPNKYGSFLINTDTIGTENRWT